MRRFRKDFLWNGSVRSVWQHFPLAKSKNDIKKNEHFEKLQALFYIIIFLHELMIAKTISSGILVIYKGILGGSQGECEDNSPNQTAKILLLAFCDTKCVSGETTGSGFRKKRTSY